MTNVLNALLKQPYWVIALLVGASFVAIPCVSVEKGSFSTHAPTTLWLPAVGIVLLILSWTAFGYTLFFKSPGHVGDAGAGLDLTRVKQSDGVFWTTVGGCEIRVVNGRVEDFVCEPGTAIALPCNEYFDDRCVDDAGSALGAYVGRVFEGQVPEFVLLMKDESRKKLGPGQEQQKTEGELAQSLGPGKCVLLMNPLGRTTPVALVSTTTQRAGEGLSARISYLFDGTRSLVTRLADTRFSKVAMPVLGAGHGQIDPPLAFVGLLLAVAEAARYGQGAQRLKKVTVIVFKPDANKSPVVDPIVVQRALALISSGSD